MAQITWLPGGPGTVTSPSATSVSLTGTGGSATTARRIFDTIPGQKYRFTWNSTDEVGTFRVGNSALRWHPPPLAADKITVNLNDAVNATKTSYGPYDSTQDVEFIAKTSAYTLERLQINGGRHIRLIGGLFRSTATVTAAVLNFINNYGSVYLEGTHVDMSQCGDRDAVNYFSPPETVTGTVTVTRPVGSLAGDNIMQNVRISDVKGRSAGTHGDAWQPQGDVDEILCYKMYISTNYQSFLMEQRLTRGDGDKIALGEMEKVTVQRINTGDATSKIFYFCETDTPQFPLTLKDVYGNVTETSIIRAESHYMWPPTDSPVGGKRSGNRVTWSRINGYVTVNGGPDYAPALNTGLNYQRSESEIGGSGISFVQGANSFEFTAANDKTYLEFWRNGSGLVTLSSVALTAVTETGTPGLQPVETIRFGASDPDSTEPASLLLQAIYGWPKPLSDIEALPISSNLSATPSTETGALPVISIPSSLSVLEGQTLQVQVTKMGAGACTFRVRSLQQTAVVNVDYTGFNEPFSMASGDSVLFVPLTALNDSLPDSGERVNVELSQPAGCTLGNAVCTVTITDLPRLSLPTSVSVTEGGVASIIVSKIGSGACTATWRAQSGTATVTSDYTNPGTPTLTFGVDEMSKTLTVQTATDALAEGVESFSVILENPVGCSLTTPTCTVRILDPGSTETPHLTAFAPATGFASAAPCGLGFPVYRVTNLNDSGAGSLRQGATAGNCFIVFEVSGRITLLSDLVFGSNVTIAGETAPAPGITVQRKEFRIQGSNVRVSHITFQRGYDATDLANADCGKIGAGSTTVPANGPVTSQNIHFSHCAFFHSMDENVEHWPSASRRLLDISYHDCIFAEPLHLPRSHDSTLSNHSKVKPNGLLDDHTYGVLVGYNTRRVDFQHCIFSNMTLRSPAIDHGTEVVLANTIANNCRSGATVSHTNETSPLPFLLTCKGYLAISGPDTGGGPYGGLRWHSYAVPQPANSKAYAANLYGWKGGTSASVYQTPLNTVSYAGEVPYWMSGSTRIPVMVDSPPIDTPVPVLGLTDQQMYDRAISNGGPRPKEVRNPSATANKDVRRVVDQLVTRTGRFVDHENQVGGLYAPAQVNRALNGSTVFADGTLIPVVPSQPQPATDASRKAMKDWIRMHLNQIQHD